MKTKITQVGTSVGVIIPRYIAAEGGFIKGASVNIEYKDEKITISKLSQPRKGWDKAFEDYAKEGEDELMLPDFFDNEAMDLL